MKNELLKRINSILNEEDEAGFETPVDTTVDDTTTDFSTDEVPTDETGEEEVETLTSYVAGVEEMLTPEQKEEVKSFIQGLVEGASEEGAEDGEEEVASDETEAGEEMVEVPEEPTI